MEKSDGPLIKRDKSLKEEAYHVIKEMILMGKLDNKIIHNEKTISDLLGGFKNSCQRSDVGT